MNINQAFPSKFLSKEDVKDAPRIGVIDSVDIQELDGDEGKEQKPTLFFSNDLKPMILNRINWMMIADLYGEDSDGWTGNKIEVYHDPSIMFGAKRVGGVRVRKPAVIQAQASTRATKIQELTTIRKQIHELGGTMPAKETLRFDTDDELESVLNEHRGYLEKAMLEKAL